MDGIDLFKEYLIEREGKLLHYDEEKRGFVSYSFSQRHKDECFIDDIFILDHKRDIKVLLALVRFVEDQAKMRGLKWLTGAVNIKKPDSDKILKAHLYYKMKPFHIEGSFIYMGKEIK
jgi:predicted GNAT superfamily acetyltransferase